MFDLTDTIYEIKQNEDSSRYYFCGDDLYGYYSKEQLIELRSAIWCRITEVLKGK